MGMLILSLLSAISLIGFQKRIKRIQVTKDKQELLLCSKKINGETQKLIHSIQNSNQLLTYASTTKLLSIALPGLGIFSKISIKRAIEAIKLSQKKKIFDYISHLSKMRLRNCRYPLSLLKTPINIQGISIKRDHFNRALFRRKQWIILTYGDYFLIKSTIPLKGATKSSIHKKVSFWWKPSFGELFSSR